MKKLIVIAAALSAALPAIVAAQQGQGGSRMFAMADANSDGKLDKAEVTKMMQMRAERRGDPSVAEPAKIDAFIKRADTNGDGAVDQAELAATRKAREAKPQEAE